MMRFEDRDGKLGYIIESTKDALECLTIVESFADDEAVSNTTYLMAANGLDRWLKKQITP